MRTRCAHTGGGWLNDWENRQEERYCKPDEGEETCADNNANQNAQSTTQVTGAQVGQSGSEADKPTTWVQTELFPPSQ